MDDPDGGGGVRVAELGGPVVIDDEQVLAAVAVLLFADADVVGAALDRIIDSADVYRRDRYRLAVALLHAADEDVPQLVERLWMSCDPWLRRTILPRAEGRDL